MRSNHTAGRVPKSLAGRTAAKIGPVEANGCQIWQAYRDESGYGRINSGRARGVVPAHRVIWEFANGPIPEGMCVLHQCDNGAGGCVRLEHLYLGTRTENIRDAVLRGRIARGDRHGTRTHPERIPRGESRPASKLTEDQVREIRRLHAAGGTTQVTLGRQLGVHPSTIWNVVQRRLWTHVE